MYLFCAFIPRSRVMFRSLNNTVTELASNASSNIGLLCHTGDSILTQQTTNFLSGFNNLRFLVAPQPFNKYSHCVRDGLGYQNG